MGVLISAESPASGTPYNQWKIYRATSQSGTYTLLTTQNITDLTYYDSSGASTHWYKISYYDSINTVESTQSDAFKPLTETYTTVKKIESLLQISSRADDTKPSIQQIMEMINWAEDEIDEKCQHAWRERTVTNEIHNLEFPYYWGTGVPIYLNYRKVRNFDTNEGDKIEIWDGSNWVDWVTDYTEGRGDDWWCDYEMGILYIKNVYKWTTLSRVRVTYRYGETSVPKDIEQACTMMVAQQLLMSDTQSVIIPEVGGMQPNFMEKVKYWEERVEKILGRRADLKTMNK